MTPELRFAFNEVYAVFAPYKDTLDCARKCGINRPLHLLTREDWDNINDEFDMIVLLWDSTRFCHFLPRILEWIYEANNFDFEFGRCGLWNLSHHLAHFGWLNWPTVEVEALRRVFRLWTSQALLDQNEHFPINFLLELADDFALYCNSWLEVRPFDVARWLTIQNWHQPNSAALQWMVSPFVEEQLEKAFWAAPDSEGATLCSRALQLIASLRTMET